MKTRLAVAALLTIFAVLVISGMRQNSATCDEIAHHIPVGYVLLTKWDFNMDPSQPVLPRYIVALPLKLFMNTKMPDDKSVWRVDDRSSFGRDFFYKYNNDQMKMVFFARMAVVFIGILCGLLLFMWTKALWGDRAALFALFLYSLCPNILAHVGLATTDMIAAFFILLSCWSFWLFLKDGSFKNAALAGICLGLAQLSKYTAILLYPLFLFLLILELFLSIKTLRRRYLPMFSLIVLISLAVTWAAYGFEFQPILKDAMRVDEKLEIAHSISSRVLPFISQKSIDRFLLETPVPLSSHMLGIIGVLRHSHEGHGTYFLGRLSAHGDLLYFAMAFLIKTPIPMLAFLITGIFICLRRPSSVGERLVLITAAYLFITASFSGLKLGLRHILPIYPFCFMIAGRTSELLDRRYFKIVAYCLAAWYIVSASMTWPHYLGYFNEIAGGPSNGYKYLRDSNVDWGQDLPALASYMKKNGIEEVALEYFGQADPGAYGVRCRRFGTDEFERPGRHIYAVSAQYLEHARWADRYKPTAKAGYSIFIYDLRRGAQQ